MPDRKQNRRSYIVGLTDIVTGVVHAVTALSMTVGRGAAARTVAGLAGLVPGDDVVDIGCGPGTAVREAARRGARATGVDPDRAMLRLGRSLTALRRAAGVSFVEGGAERLPVPDCGTTVVWALTSVHHWPDRPAAIREIRRVLKPGGRVLLAERLA
jgi:ubiquinone/menaquinone biosynthesis C-methylase UbiE